MAGCVVGHELLAEGALAELGWQLRRVWTRA